MPLATFPQSLHVIASISLGLAILCAGVIAVDELRRPQSMWIMNLVWPLTALFGGILWLAAYYAWGRTASTRASHGERATPLPVAVFKGTSHCGAGCALADIIVEWLAVAAPVIATWFGWGTLFSQKMFAVWIADFVLAFLLGIAFQYFMIQPMRDISRAQGLVAAVKADFASITAWQLGMYGMMALLQFGWFCHAFAGLAPVAGVEYWFAMQIAMLAGFVTSYPVNWALVRAGWKERM